jgi:DNA repair exonuclease SbcCD ATPase subunit
MLRMKYAVSCIMIGAIMLCGGMMGCTQKPSQAELSKLDEAKSAAESAEKKLSELRQERMKLEQDLGNKQMELKDQEQEQENLKSKMGK